MNTIQTETQLEEKIENIVNNLFKSFTNFFKYLPFFLIIGILYQFINLVIIDKLVYFSWTQVINDTVSLFFPVIFGILGIIIGFFVGEEKIKDFFIGILFSVLYLIILGIFPYIFGFKILYIPLIIGFIGIVIGKIFILIKLYTGSQKMKSSNNRLFMKFIFLIFTFSLIFFTIKDLNYKNIYIIDENNKAKVIYMNDKYIILEKKAIANTENVIFYFNNK